MCIVRCSGSGAYNVRNLIIMYIACVVWYIQNEVLYLNEYKNLIKTI